MTQPNNVKKYFGNDGGTWWCRFGECLYIFSADDIKDMDRNGEISWARPDKNQDIVLPICPYHGSVLSHAENNQIKIDDSITLLM